MDTHKQNYLFAKDILDAVSNADRRDEIAQMGRLLTIDELSKIQEFVKKCEDQGLHLLCRSLN